MKVASFNVNGIRARLHQLEALVSSHQPDIIGLQETKVEDALFPVEAIHKLGYEVVFHGQRGHYGVALLYRGTLLSSSKGLPSDGDEAQCRLTGVTLDTSRGPFTVYNGYFPQGENRSHPVKFANKERFYKGLTELLGKNHKPDEALIVLGDMNVAPMDKDIGIGDANRKRWLREGKCCFLPEEREWLEALRAWGLEDCFENIDNTEGEQRYSWFDYRSKGFEASPRRGLRIDLVLATKPLIARQQGAGIDHRIRAMEKPSDHCPVWIDLDW